MNYLEKQNNKVYLQGEVVTKAIFSHEVYGEGFYEMNVSVKRLSGQTDILPVTISERLIAAQNLGIGSQICAVGQFRSYNKVCDGKSRLMLTVFVRELCENPLGKNPNSIALSGMYANRPYTAQRRSTGRLPTFCLRSIVRITSPITFLA